MCHSKLLQRLCGDFEVRGTLLTRIDSYVSNRQQFIKMGQYSAPTTYCTWGVPQGSVLGRFFLLHTCRQLLTSFPVMECCFINTLTTHNYVAAKAKVDTTDALKTVSSCTYAVQTWFLLNDLLNPDKSEVMVIGTGTQVKAYLRGDHLDVAGTLLKLRDNVKSLGVIFR